MIEIIVNLEINLSLLGMYRLKIRPFAKKKKNSK